MSPTNWPMFLWLSAIWAISDSKEGEAESKQPWLTDGVQVHRLQAVNGLDQCYRQPGLTRMNAFAIRLVKPPAYACDGLEDALLICYESMLYDGAPKASLGLTPSTPFRIWPNKTNKVAQLCAKRNGTSPNSGTISDPKWHGIFIRSEKIDGKEVIILETALDDHKIQIENNTQFDIVLMSRKAYYTELMTTQLESGKRLKLADPHNEAFRKAYAENLHSGVMLQRYKGLWALGLDMMPQPETGNTLQLYVYRACNCTMEAYVYKN